MIDGMLSYDGIEEGGFPRSVGADQPGDDSLLDGKGDVLISLDSTKRFGNRLDLNDLIHASDFLEVLSTVNPNHSGLTSWSQPTIPC